MEKTCFFIGHRDSPEAVYPLVQAAVERHIAEEGVRRFVVGMYGHFDTMAQRAVIEAKQRHPEVTLEILTPYHPSVRKVDLPQGADGLLYPEGMERVPPRAAIVRANEYMVRNADYLIAYTRFAASKARDLVDYAREREKQGKIRITQLAKEIV